MSFKSDVVNFQRQVVGLDAALDRLSKLSDAPARRTRAGRVSMTSYRQPSRKAADDKLGRVLATFLEQCVDLIKGGRYSDAMDATTTHLQKHSGTGPMADLIAATGTLGRLVCDVAETIRPAEARKGYPEYRDDQPRDTHGRWGGGGSVDAASRPPSAARQKLEAEYKERFGVSPPKRMSQAGMRQRIDGGNGAKPASVPAAIKPIAEPLSEVKSGGSLSSVAGALRDGAAAVGTWMRDKFNSLDEGEKESLLINIIGVTIIAGIAAYFYFGGRAPVPSDGLDIVNPVLDTLRWIWKHIP